MLVGEDVPDDVAEHATVGLVLALALFVLHNTALLVELVLRNGANQVAHAIGLHPARQIERCRGHGLKVVGAVERRRAVNARRSDALEWTKPLVIVVLGAVEHEELEQVRDPRASGALVL